jgi:putative endonuclease
MNRLIIGKIGEDAAEKYLRKKRYQIVERNFRTKFGEIDLICKFENILVFVEVKTKTGSSYGEQWEMVSKRKLEKVKRMAQVYLSQQGQGEVACRIDVVGVWLVGGVVDKLEHWEAVY